MLSGQLSVHVLSKLVLSCWNSWLIETRINCSWVKSKLATEVHCLCMLPIWVGWSFELSTTWAQGFTPLEHWSFEPDLLAVKVRGPAFPSSPCYWRIDCLTVTGVYQLYQTLNNSALQLISGLCDCLYTSQAKSRQTVCLTLQDWVSATIEDSHLPCSTRLNRCKFWLLLPIDTIKTYHSVQAVCDSAVQVNPESRKTSSLLKRLCQLWWNTTSIRLRILDCQRLTWHSGFCLNLPSLSFEFWL